MKQKEARGEKVDGYVAWHSTQRADFRRTFSNDEKNSLNQLFDYHYGEWPDDDSKKDCALVKGLLKEGWKIRPVKLLFLDEEK